MTKQDLEQIRDTEKNIKAKQDELEALRYKASGAGAIRYDKDRVQTSPQDYMAMAVADIVEIEKQISEAQAEIEQMKGDAYALVRRMDKPEQRTIIEWYYLNGLSMANTALHMNMSERSAYYLREDALETFESLQAISVDCRE